MPTDPDLNDLFSDGSSFYGDEETKSHLEHQANTYDPGPYWEKIHPNLYTTIKHNALVSASVAKPTDPMSPPPPQPNPNTGVHVEAETPASMDSHNAPRTDESVQSFLARLPPSTTKAENVGPWIYVSDPGACRTEQDIASFVAGGTRLLRGFEDERAELEVSMDRAGTLQKARKLVPLRRRLEGGIFALARETGVVSGKWMLFLTGEVVDRVWGVVVEETVEGRLGVAAKVATDDGEGRARLLAVYTRDFGDGADVKRVLERLVELGLVEKGGRPVYYKCDAYTYLEIMSNNSYGLRASLFSSRDVLEGKRGSD
ncbi:DUF1917 domain-containing protein [Aspergillus alliaceus]|uniref:DUF1917 domain-containing protein n=1 Tax=Petromyces alliaceus TaxID=209559 RepID=UPI0012A44B53|nr:uncharacterized protein BDW43DRAFT_303289 [Aspergillus alliaceus]KAB8229164.1 hypothetical protein BDW43DRAFT_303289 [Aspergillus alliaceus]